MKKTAVSLAVRMSTLVFILSASRLLCEVKWREGGRVRIVASP